MTTSRRKSDEYELTPAQRHMIREASNGVMTALTPAQVSAASRLVDKGLAWHRHGLIYVLNASGRLVYEELTS